MVSYNMIMFLNNENLVEHFECWDLSRENNERIVWSEYEGKKVDSFLDIDINTNTGYLFWKGMTLRYIKTSNVSGSGNILYMTSDTDNCKLLEEAFDCIKEGIQIYDQNGYLVFCNKFSEKIEKTDRTKITGKHLMDIYEVDEAYSTILNTIKYRKPVVNRCDIFKNKTGEMITTMNSGYPLYNEGNLIGAAVMVQDTSVIDEYERKRNDLEKFLAENGRALSEKKKKGYTSFKTYSFADLIGESENFLETVKLASSVAARDTSVLIYGETGTGKELFAQSIHSASKRRNKEFIAVNCAAIPENLIEGILFGTDRGTFTGSMDRMGLFEQAEGGTLFLDEINSMNIHMQSKLLRVLQEKSFRRVGGLKDIKCDVRIISSTNEEPFSAIENNRIRKDLYYRISTVLISIPALRERKKDIELLLKYFLERLSRNYSKKIRGASDDVINLFYNYDWPGNVRELLHVLEYAFNTMEGDLIQKDNLPKYLNSKKEDSRKEILQCRPLKDILEECEKKVLMEALKRNAGNITKTADELNIKRQSMQYRLKKYNLDR